MEEQIEIELGGRVYKGWYRIDGRMIRVTHAGHTKTTQLGGTPAPVMAQMLLRELIQQQASQG